LGIFERLDADVLLHHFLVKARHGDGDEGAADEMLPEVVTFGRIPGPNLGELFIFEVGPELSPGKIHLLLEGVDTNHQGQ
jgi:hypothetical protein